MGERMDYFHAVEVAVYKESGFQVPQSSCMLLAASPCTFRVVS